MPMESQTAVLDLEPSTATFLTDVLGGLRRRQKQLPCKYFYDRRGSQLFDAICELDEYYPTRTELAIMEQHAGEVAEQVGPGVALVEYGSGSSVKTRLLLDALQQPIAYVPVDISHKHLHAAADRIAGAYPDIDVLPVCADFTRPFALPAFPREPTHAAVYFPGSTIGNFEPHAARTLLENIARSCGQGGGLVIGVDLQKEPHVIEAAYNDAEGVTARFNLNLLHRINRELDADFQVDAFRHRAFYDRRRGRVEISLVSEERQRVEVQGETFEFERGESILTEYSHKYTPQQFAEIAAEAGLAARRVWTDPREWFAVIHLVVE